jgi:hypothetical protein
MDSWKGFLTEKGHGFHCPPDCSGVWNGVEWEMREVRRDKQSTREGGRSAT